LAAGSTSPHSDCHSLSDARVPLTTLNDHTKGHQRRGHVTHIAPDNPHVYTHVHTHARAQRNAHQELRQRTQRRGTARNDQRLREQRRVARACTHDPRPRTTPCQHRRCTTAAPSRAHLGCRRSARSTPAPACSRARTRRRRRTRGSTCSTSHSRVRWRRRRRDH
jgi:hypothetical protein